VREGGSKNENSERCITAAFMISAPIRLLGAKKVRWTGHLSAYAQNQIILQATRRKSLECIHLARIRDLWRAFVNEWVIRLNKIHRILDQLRNY
jgi:hypothetical protein